MKRITCWLIASFLLFYFAPVVFSQCGGTYFNTGYQKIAGSIGERKVEDWTGDGKPDLWGFVSNTTTSVQDVYIYPNDGNGQFNWNNPIVSPTTIPSDGLGYDSYRIFDFNSDNKKDIFYSYGGFTKIYLNNGNNTFTPLAQIDFPEETTFLGTIGFIDVNNDNLLDWIRWSNAPNQSAYTYRLGNADGTFGPRVDILVSPGLQNPFNLIADYTGDGRQDIAYTYYSGQNLRLRVLINNGNGTFTFGPENNNYNNGQTIPADLNNDGKADLVTLYYGSSNPPVIQLFIYRNNGDASFTRTELPVFRADAGFQIKIADFNGDSAVDIIELGNSFYSVHLNNGSGSFTRTDYQTRLVSNADSIVFADFNNDNKADLYRLNRESTIIHNIFGEQIVVIEYNQCQPRGLTKYASFDSNSSPDLIRWNPETGDWASINGEAFQGSYPEVKIFNWGRGSLGDIPSPGDFDGDGKTDYAVFRNSTGVWYIFQSSNSNWLSVAFGLPGDIPVPADYDGGGKTDIAVFRPSNGTWYIWYSETQQFYFVRFGLNGDRPVAQDYDGDGKTDVGVFRPNEGNWYYLRSSDQTFAGVHWGIATDKPVPADYDGDGKADLAVWRDGDWYILRSFNNSFNFIHWGISSDVAFPFYSNATSAAPVVYRPSNWYWYRYSPYGNGTTTVFGGSQNVPIVFGQPNN